ncbi:hypothetical protein FPV67DRAFT_1616599 [Lyophyllum atratum]|nr:hypothetical protein FPV67DRAFT_1616599 [Lyophyllum atratum]
MTLFTGQWRTIGLRNCCDLYYKQASQALCASRLILGPRFQSNSQSTSTENVNVGHSKFLAEAPPAAKWREGGNGASRSSDDVAEGKGKVLPTSSHLFKLVLSLGKLSLPANKHEKPPPHDLKGKPAPPTVILLHPSQPLSHVSRLILASISPANPVISFRSTSSSGRIYQWSDSTDIGDFIKDAARSSQFSICFTYNPAKMVARLPIDVEIPTFADRTRFLRRRLHHIQRKLELMENLKRDCDREARRGAKRMAMGGFGMLVVYWGAVARLTFWDFGWDVMEPITYLSGLSTVICGYLWFLYQGREVSYSSVLDQSISTRREALYKSRGLDIDQWMDFVAEAKSLRREISRIAEDYDEEEEGKKAARELGSEEEKTRRTRKRQAPDSESEPQIDTAAPS